MLQASLIIARLHAFIGGSVNRTVNSARLPNRQDWRIGQNNYMADYVKKDIS